MSEPNPYLMQAPINQRAVEALQFAVQVAMTEEFLTGGQPPEVAIQWAGRQLVARLSKDIHGKKLRRDVRTFPVSVKVPWSCDVAVTLPRTWWQRLRRQPASVVFVPASGTVTGHAKVEVTAEHWGLLPDMPRFPVSFGQPIRYLDAQPATGSLLAEEAATRPRDGVSHGWDQL